MRAPIPFVAIRIKALLYDGAIRLKEGRLERGFRFEALHSEDFTWAGSTLDQAHGIGSAAVY
jgi:hypothetical protein